LYPAAEKAGMSLWLRQISTGTANRLTPPENVGFYAFAVTPDNSYIYYILNRKNESQPSGLYKIPLFGGEPQRIKEGVGSLAISPDGTRIALVRNENGTQIFTVNPNGEDERIVKTLPENSRLWNVGWTPDSTKLLCAIRKTIDDKPIYYVAEIAPETGKETIVLPDTERVIYGAAWMPDKSSLLLVVRESNADIRQIWQYFPASLEWRRVTNDNNSYQSANLTRDGKNIVSMQSAGLSAIWVADNVSPTSVKSENFRQITGGANSFDRLGLLADGRVAYSTTENTKEVVYTINFDGSNARRITNGDDGMWLTPVAARNGRSVCFFSARAGGRQFWRINPDGKNLTKLTETPLSVISAQLLSDNSSVIYAAQNKTGETLLFHQTADGQTAQLTESDTGSWAISQDEKFLAIEIVDKQTRKYRVEVRSFEDGKTINIFDFPVNRQINFTPDGKNLAYDFKRGDASQIMLQPLNGGEPFALTDFQSDDIFDFDWSADGTRLAVIRGKHLNDAVLINSHSNADAGFN
jgi:Tol biopolymer transport system component